MLVHFLLYQDIPRPVDAFMTKQFTLGSYESVHVLYRSMAVKRIGVVRAPIDIDGNKGDRNKRENYENDSKLQKPMISKQTSTFWFSDPEREPLSEDRVLPCEYNLDPNGPLPFGSYRTVGDSLYDPKRLCLVTAGVTLRNVEKRNEIDTSLALANAHKMIDSGLTSFQVHIPRECQIHSPEGSMESGMESNSEQEWIEQNIYKKLIQETPSSVLSLCNLGTKISVPYWNCRGNIGKGSMVRQKIGDSILNIFGNAGGCLDSVHVDFRSGPTLDSASPYTLDVLDTLFDMKREGLIRSIHGIEFPASVLAELKQCNFYLDTNQVTCNLLNPNDCIGSMQQVCKEYEQEGRPLKLILKSPLAGGLLTNKYHSVPNKYRGKNGEPATRYMTPSEKWGCEFALKKCWLQGYTERENVGISKQDIWMFFEKKVLEVMSKIALKHRVDVASVAVRWTMQQDHLASVLVGTGLNMQYDSDLPFPRPKDFRKPFTFHLDEEDMERLWSVCGANHVRNDEKEFDPTIDISNRRLWL